MGVGLLVVVVILGEQAKDGDDGARNGGLHVMEATRRKRGQEPAQDADEGRFPVLHGSCSYAVG